MFDADLIEMGPAADGIGLTADKTEWPDSCTQYDILVTRERSGGVREPVLELEFPFQHHRLAREVFEVIQEAVTFANDNQRIVL